MRRSWRTVFGKQLATHAAVTVTVPNLYVVLSAADTGAGKSVLPRSLCPEYLDSGRPALLHEPGEPPLNTLFLVQRSGSETHPDVLRGRETLQPAARSR